MELYQQMIIRGLERGELGITLTDETMQWMEGKCYRALERIREIVADESLGDEACFRQVEQIVLALEEAGTDGGARHDF